ncbi:hypothetical protein F2B00_22165 [Streptomyces parvus]|uniref:hypothetical protein n=1 Tax=Streptomyces parvus TaxID=66428 RepID=UPI0012396927|nr:hypothetical protein [Streptomyces parvus]KAA6200086.1 hypothetical protein F2B00_22165 [Streptomyces parvus]GGS41432.1 hypothetical protein GCM10010221_45290 [Streptomyces parvus]
MGVRLIVEVLDHWQDAGLTAGERSDLLLLAENANDQSRLTWGPVHAEYVLHRANKSAAGWKNSIGKLIKKGVLVQHAQGHVGQVAVYRLAQLCPEAPHDGWRGHCTRPERVTPEVTLSEDGPEKGHLSDDPQGHSSGDPLERKGHLTGAERVISQVTPTPPVSSFKTPSNTSSSPAAESLPAARESATEGGGGGDSFFEGPATTGPSVGQGVAVAPPSAELHPLAEPFVAALDFRGRPPGSMQRGRLVALIAAALDAGWAEQDLKTYLDLGGAAVNSAAAVYAHRLGADELPDSVTFREAARRPLEGTDAVVDGWMQLAGRSGPHRPYQDSWRRLEEEGRNGARPQGWEKWKHCGEPECDEVTRRRDEAGWDGLLASVPCPKCHPAMKF